MKIPTQSECFNLIDQMTMMDHIIDHSIMVSNVARYLCKNLKTHYPNLDIDLAMSAALLHDITKTRSFDTGEIHSLTGGKLLSEMGYPEVGDIVRQHVLLDRYRPSTPVSMAEIVNYADKRVLHDKVVSLEKRLDYIKVRYATNDKLKKKLVYMKQKTQELEDKLFSFLDIEPDQLADKIDIIIFRED